MKFLQQVHEGHLGTSKMKGLIRSIAYWPGFNEDAENFVRNCDSCSIFQKENCRPPIAEIASKTTFPFEQIAIDLTGPSSRTNDKILLTCIDLYSRYPEVYILSRGTTSEITRCLTDIFSRFGIPRSVLTDNGTSFVSKEMTEFFDKLGIRHIRASNYHPMANGCVERFHKTLKERIERIIHSHAVMFEAALLRALFDIRSTPNAMTGKTPAKMFLGRQLLRLESLLIENEPSPSSCKRSAEKEYATHKSTCPREYKEGDIVLFRKGKGLFSHQGKVVRKTGQYTYKIMDINNRREASYNVRDLKNLSEIRNDNLLIALDAYDETTNNKTRKRTNGRGNAPRHRYNLRSRTRRVQES